jgi:hypothetical protein
MRPSYSSQAMLRLLLLSLFTGGGLSAWANDVVESSAESAEAAELQIFGAQDDGQEPVSRGYTSHFNLDNRGLASPATTTTKFRCLVECKLANGSTRWHSTNDARRVNVGELDIVDINGLHQRVVKCRFWWKLRPLGRYSTSEWVVADHDHYIVYAFLVWTGENDYETPIHFYQEPLHAPAYETAEDEVAAKSVDMYFVHDFSFNEPVRVHINGPYGATSFQLSKGSSPACIPFRDETHKRTIAAYRVSTGELVTLTAFVPCHCSMLVSEGVCEDEIRTEPIASPESTSKSY